MALTNTEVIIFVVFVVIGSIITAWLYNRITRGITRKQEERSTIRLGRMGKASERIVKKE